MSNRCSGNAVSHLPSPGRAVLCGFAESGIEKYEWTVIITQRSNTGIDVREQMFEWVDVGLNRSAFVDGMHLVQGVRYSTIVRATNKAGLTSRTCPHAGPRSVCVDT